MAPESGSTIVLQPDATVTSEGPATIHIGGLIAIPVQQVDLNFQGAQMQAADLGSGAPTLGIPMGIGGVPFLLSTGGSLQTLDPPWQSTPGKTSLTLNLQLPTTLNATSWASVSGAFHNGPFTVPSVGGVMTFSVTNRYGLTAPEVCAKFNGGEFKLWNLNVNTSWISQAQACYDISSTQWTLTGLFQLPEKTKLGNKVNVSVGWIKGWNWDNFSIEADGINKPLAEGVFCNGSEAAATEISRTCRPQNQTSRFGPG